MSTAEAMKEVDKAMDELAKSGKPFTIINDTPTDAPVPFASETRQIMLDALDKQEAAIKAENERLSDERKKANADALEASQRAAQCVRDLGENGFLLDEISRQRKLLGV